MGVPQWITDNYAKQRPYLASLDSYLRAVLLPYCERNGFAFSHRVKAENSIAEKLESGRFESWSELDDLVAATIVVPNLTYEEQVTRHLDSVFTQKAVRSRHTANTPPEVFRFNSTRWYGVVRADPPPPDLPSESIAIVFEVQIQTALEHAWLIATHDITYKGVDVDWQKLRLAASVKASVEQLDLMIGNFIATAAYIPPSPHPETEARRHIVETFQQLISEQFVDGSLTPESWSRFADNLWSLVQRRRGGGPTTDKVVRFAGDMASAIRRNDFNVALSGSLFQAVIGFAHRTDPTLLSHGFLVPSVELADFYGISDVPRPIRALDDPLPHSEEDAPSDLDESVDPSEGQRG